MTPLGTIVILLSPALFFLVETMFYRIITRPYSENLGYYGRFHRGVQVVLEGVVKGLKGLSQGLEVLVLWLQALAIFCGGTGVEDHEMRGDFAQASPPPYDFVSALRSIFFYCPPRPSHRMLWPLTKWSLLEMRRREERTQTGLFFIFIYLAEGHGPFLFSIIFTEL